MWESLPSIYTAWGLYGASYGAITLLLELVPKATSGNSVIQGHLAMQGYLAV
jgi:hypothetical protein